MGNMVCKIGGKEYKVLEIIKDKRSGITAPLVDMPMMSDYEWQKGCLEDRLKNPAKYAEIEDVDAAIERLKKWLAEHEQERDE